jgi:hypothetical protein
MLRTVKGRVLNRVNRRVAGASTAEVFVLLRTRRDLLPFELIQDNVVN